MKKKLFIFTFLILSIISLNFIKEKEVKADTISDLSYAKGVNLIDRTNLEYTESSTISTINNIYVSNPYRDLCVQLDEEYCDNYPKIMFTLYDIDFNEVGYFDTGYLQFTEQNGKLFAWYAIDLAEYENVISVKISMYPVSSMAPGETPPIMASYNTYPLDEYVPFERAVGIFDLSDDNVPTLEVEYNYPLTEDEIAELITCYDGYSGNITEYLDVDASIYLSGKTTKGTYEILISVTDGANNTQNGHFYIRVVDKDSPLIAGPSNLNFPVNSTITDQMILSNYTASDGYDGDLTSSITINTSYTEHPVTLTQESVSLSVADESGNTANFTVNLNFYDNVPPVITAPDSLTYGYQVELALTEITSNNISVTDNFDDSPTLVVESDSYTGNERRCGTYNVTFKATDRSGNISTKTISITVSDQIKPVILLNTYAIKVTASVNLERLDFDNLLYAAGVLKRNKNYTAKVLKDTYTGHEDEVGNYVYQVKYLDDDGVEIEKTFQINVDYDTYKINANARKQLSYKMIALIAISPVVLASIVGIYILVKNKKKKKSHTN